LLHGIKNKTTHVKKFEPPPLSYHFFEMLA
jgi:hypothetical protein